MFKCSQCGNLITNSRMRFCDQCGSEIDYSPENQPSAEQQPQAPPENTNPASAPSNADLYQKHNAYLEQLKEAWADGALTSEQAGRLAQLRTELGISIAEADRLREKAIESLRPVQHTEQPINTAIDSTQGLTLYLNTNQFYMQGFSGVIDLKIENQGGSNFDSVKIELSGNLLGRAELASFRLGSSDSKRRRFPIRQPDVGGIELLQFRLNARRADTVFSFWAETTITVLPRVESAKDIQIQAENLVNLGQASDKFNIGGVINLNIDEMIKRNKINTAHDFMVEYSKLAPNFRSIELEYDPERSQQLTESLTAETKPKSPRTVISPERGTKTDSASLRVQSREKCINIVLLSKMNAGFGRASANDITTRILPRSEINDPLSVQISSNNHCNIELADAGIFVRDNDTANGTTLDGQNLDANGSKLKAGDVNEIVIANVLGMKLQIIGEKKTIADSSVYSRSVNADIGYMWETAAKHKLTSIKIDRLNNLSPADTNGSESYCLIYRTAHIGSNPDCALCFEEKGLEPLHAKLIYLAGTYYLENLCDLTDVVVNDITLSKGQIVPLNFGDKIRIARLAMVFTQKAQLFVDI